MIHFLMPSLPRATDTPLARCMVDSGLQHRLFSGKLRLRYKFRLWLILVGWPTIALYGLRLAFKSLTSTPVPRVIVVYSHIEVLMVSAVRLFLRRQQTKIVLMGFILTARRGRFHNYLRGKYFRFIFSLTSLVVVHSQTEAKRYADQFEGCGSRFVFIPWATHVNGLDALRTSNGPKVDGDNGYILTAGRSGRDYRTLFEAFRSSNHRVRVVCDYAAALNGCRPSANIEVYDHCYGEAYLKQLWNAYCVVIPLAVDDISAGQMVLIQAMAMGKPIVITGTTTTAEYLTDGYDGLCVPACDPIALREAVDRLFKDQQLSKRLGTNAESTYSSRFSIPVFVSRLLQEIKIIDPRAGQDA
jgi:glycosyltransferase involved in cell wall biosynthesis